MLNEMSSISSAKQKYKNNGNDIDLDPKIVGLRLYYCLSKNQTIYQDAISF